MSVQGEPAVTSADGARSGFLQHAANLAPVGYLGFFVIVVDQAIQVLVTVDGFAASAADWRFQFATALATRMAPLAVGFLAALAATAASRSEVGVRVLWWVALLTAAVLGLAAVVLWFDGVVVKGGVAADELSGFTAQWLRSEVLSAVGCLFFGWLAIGARRMR